MYQIDLNSDLGEGFGAYTIGHDDQVLAYVTSANIACGFHAGDHNIMYQTVQLALKHGVSIGAHPGLPDLLGFGRRYIQVEPRDVYNFILYQVGALQAFAQVHGTTLNHVKPHGALFNMATNDKAIAKAIAEAIYDLNPELILFGLAGSELVKAGEEIGLYVAEEAFADRTYQPDGSLTPRIQSNALIRDVDAAVKQVIRIIKEGKVTAVDGMVIDMRADTICIHGDEPSAVEFVKQLRQALIDHGITVKRVERQREQTRL